ncbi:hypothetical protein PTTG_09326 [Puccinia triticina 1-1 BBBD Race 1]|uniref:DDE Tnp4 domain-containing protein n=1 Tax=Puccinia triticina (isolate 1-1 / race 1 (BBBD)) TaxID=630390 RepID=A0A180G5J1_PUCT1|nr:hypothetical protein PTTG_09326 [Puccinia triticina 1-1 BBBD Race 1]
MSNKDFRQAARTSKLGFIDVLDLISHQLAITLERLGMNGNGASVGRFSKTLNVGVIEAIITIGCQYVVWPDANCRAEILDAMRKEGFEGCVGFVDGTTIPLFQRPGYDSEVFYDQKRRYSVNAQIICDCNKYITLFITGWLGTCGDSRVYKQMQLHNDPSNLFDEAPNQAPGQVDPRLIQPDAVAGSN